MGGQVEAAGKEAERYTPVKWPDRELASVVDHTKHVLNSYFYNLTNTAAHLNCTHFIYRLE